MRKLLISLYIVSLLLPSSLSAQTDREKQERARIDSLVNPSLWEKAQTVIRFDSLSRNVGMMSETDSPRTLHFVFHNISASALRLARVRTSCGCTEAGFSTQPVQPGGKGEIALTFHPKNMPGTVDTQAFVYTDASDRHPVARLSLTGYVNEADPRWRHLPLAMGALRVRYRMLQIEGVTPLTRRTERFLCGNSGNKPLRISSKVIPPFVSLYCEPTVIQPGEEAELVITVDGSKLPVVRKGQKIRTSLLLEGVDARPSQRTITLIIN